MQPFIDMTRALMGGTSAMREASTKYLPKFAMEEPESYERRLSRSTLHPAYSRTIKTLTGKPFSKQINTDKVSEQIKPLLIDIDLEGRNLDAFASEAFEFTVGNGLAGILVEFPDAAKMNLPTNDKGERSLAVEKEAGLRPYWVLIKAWQVLGWKEQRVRGKRVITQFRFMEYVDEPDTDDEYSVDRIEQIRVIEPTVWRTYRQDKNTPDTWLLHENGVNTAGFVPYVPLYGDRTGFMMGKPALTEMAHLVVKHWQSQSDQDNLVHVARVPILVATGVDPNDKKFKIILGGTSVVKLDVNQTLSFVEHSGSAINAGQESLNKLEDQMKEAGAELLLLEPGEVTATKTRADSEIGRCVLQRMAYGFEDALNLALDYTGRWMRMAEDSAGTVMLFKDFGAATLAEASAQILVGWNEANKLSDQTTFEELQRRGLIRPDLSWEEEQGRLEEQGPPLADLQTQQSLEHGEQRMGMDTQSHELTMQERQQSMQQQNNDQSNVVQMQARQRFVQK